MLCFSLIKYLFELGCKEVGKVVDVSLHSIARVEGELIRCFL